MANRELTTVDTEDVAVRASTWGRKVSGGA
jgi:hypothetical protein